MIIIYAVYEDLKSVWTVFSTYVDNGQVASLIMIFTEALAD